MGPRAGGIRVHPVFGALERIRTGFERVMETIVIVLLVSLAAVVVIGHLSQGRRLALVVR